MLDDSNGLGGREVLREIARVASLDYQLRECLSGTVDRYVLLDELLETTITRAEHEASHPVLSRKWTATERRALMAFAQQGSALFDQIGWQDSKASLSQIIHSGVMQRIRAAADECLRQTGAEFTLDELLCD